MAEQEYIARNDLEQEPPIDIGEIIGQSFEEDEILSHSQALRLEVIKTARKKMHDVPAYAALALQAADGLDKQIMTKRKLGVMSALVEEDELTRSVLRNIAAQHGNTLFKQKTAVNINEIQKDDDKLPPPPSVEGVREIGVSSLTYESFMQEKGVSLDDDE